MPLDTKILSQAATEARGLAMDAVQASASGHLGLPLGCAEIGAVLFGHALSYFPEDPHWINRDRFVLSAGHGSMFLYSWLHLAGYDLSIGEIKNFRQLTAENREEVVPLFNKIVVPSFPNNTHGPSYVFEFGNLQVLLVVVDGSSERQ